MNRSARAHRSTKVPGVKLRPAPSDADASGSGSAKRARRDASRADADEDAAHFRALREAQRSREEQHGPEGSETARDWAERPLRGATLCMTGLGSEEKVALQKAAVELGASCDGNLTDDATHLIARTPGSEKYRCALTLGVPVLSPAWLTELRRRWVMAEPCELAALTEEHTLKTFEGLNIVLAGFQDPKQRAALRSQMGAAGAETPQSLDMIPGRHSHIVCEHDAPQHSNTLKAVVKFRQRASRFQRRGEALPSEGEGMQLRAAVDLLCVRAEWVEDSLAIGACMDEKKYDIFEAAPSAAEREANLQAIRDARVAKTKAFAARAAAVPRHIVPSTLNALAVQGRRGESSLLRSIAASTTEVDPEELRKREQGGGLLAISREAAFEGPSDRLQVSRTHVAATATPEPRHGRASPEKTEAAPARDAKSEAGPSRQPAGVFGGITVRIDLADESHEAVVRKAVKEHGGKAIAASDAAPANYCVSAVSRPDGGVDEPHIGERVTHFWIERCTFEGRLVAPAEHAFARPTSVRWPLQGVQQLRIATTSKVTVEDNQVERVLASMGLTTASSFKRFKYSHLFCGNGGAQANAENIKVQAAQQWGVPLIDVDAVRAAYETGIWETGAPIASRTSSTSSNAAANGAASAAAPSNTTGSQTQAALPPTSRLCNDITNSESLSQQRRAQAAAVSMDAGKGDESMAMSEVAEPEAIKNDGRMAPPAPRPLPPPAAPAAAPNAAPAAAAPLPAVTSPSGTAPSQRAAWDQSMDQATYVNEQGAAEVIGLLQTRPRRPSTSSALPMARVKSKGKAPPRVRSGRRAASGGPRSVSISPEKLQRAEGSEPPGGRREQEQHGEWQHAAASDGDADVASPRVRGSDELGSTAAVESICIVYQDPSTTKARAELEALFRAPPADGASNGGAAPSSDSLKWEHRPRASPHTPERPPRGGAAARKSKSGGGRLATSAAPR